VVVGREVNSEEVGVTYGAYRRPEVLDFMISRGRGNKIRSSSSYRRWRRGAISFFSSPSSALAPLDRRYSALGRGDDRGRAGAKGRAAIRYVAANKSNKRAAVRQCGSASVTTDTYLRRGNTVAAGPRPSLYRSSSARPPREPICQLVSGARFN
jgi:hypothetical protein